MHYRRGWRRCKPRQIRRAVRDRHAALHFLRLLRRGLPGGRAENDPDIRTGQLQARRFRIRQGKTLRKEIKGAVMAETLFFLLVAAVALISGLMVVTCKNP